MNQVHPLIGGHFTMSVTHKPLLAYSTQHYWSIFIEILEKQTVKMRYNNQKLWLTQWLKDSIKVKK